MLTKTVKDAYLPTFGAISKLSYVAPKSKRKITPQSKERGKRIADARTHAKFSQDKVATALSRTREWVSQLESGTLVGELERDLRLGLCKLLGFEEREVLLDPASSPPEFDMPLSPDAKSIAYRWDDLPEEFRTHLKRQIAEMERVKRESPELASRLYPQLEDPAPPPKKR